MAKFVDWKTTSDGKRKIILIREMQKKLADVWKNKTEFEGVFWSPEDYQYLILFKYVKDGTARFVMFNFSNSKYEGAVLYDLYMWKYFRVRPNLDSGKYNLSFLKENFLVEKPEFYKKRLIKRLNMCPLVGIYISSNFFFRAVLSVKEASGFRNLTVGFGINIIDVIKSMNEFLDSRNLSEKKISISDFKEGKYGYERFIDGLPKTVRHTGI